MAETNVRLERLTKRFADTTAVDDVSLDVAAKEFFSLLGPSGCGKTTTLRMIGGFEEPTSGRILLGGRDVTGVPPHKRDVNTVFQSYALFPHLTVFENIAYGLRRKKVPKEEIGRSVGAMLDLVDLPGFERRKPAQLSGGQQQRVAVGRALVNHPRVLLLDEPLGALDLKLRKQMQLELKRIQHEVGITFIYVTHDQEEAMTMSDRLAVMRAGRVEQVGAPRDVYEAPATPFVAGFLGASNLLSGRTEGREGEWALVRLTGGTVVRLPASRMNGSGEDVQLGVRPEKITLTEASAPGIDGGNHLGGTLRVSAYVGVSHQHTVDCPGGETITVFQQDLGGGRLPQPGDPVSLWWRPEHTFVVSHGEDGADRATEEGEDDA